MSLDKGGDTAPCDGPLIARPGCLCSLQGQELLVLGSQPLSCLRDRIYCPHDRLAAQHSASLPSAFFCIEVRRRRGCCPSYLCSMRWDEMVVLCFFISLAVLGCRALPAMVATHPSQTPPSVLFASAASAWGSGVLGFKMFGSLGNCPQPKPMTVSLYIHT